MRLKETLLLGENSEAVRISGDALGERKLREFNINKLMIDHKFITIILCFPTFSTFIVELA